MASDHQETHVDPALWRAIAGNLIHVPTVNSWVYYFPQGHIEQASSTVSLSSMAVRHSILCRVRHVSFLVDVRTDEVFVKFLLQPFKTTGGGFDGGESSASGSKTDVVSYSKVLTPSDANNGGGFSVPRICADSIFPPLDFTKDPPVQYLTIADINGKEYSFRHVYRGTPRRHLFTTGWSNFVNEKVLIGGDAVVFMKDKVTGKLFLGVRRIFHKKKEPASNESLEFVPRAAVPSGKKGFSRSNIGRVPAEKVVEAVERAMSGLGFEVVYYPRPGRPECVVAAEKVEVACGVNWSAGMRVKVAQEMEDGTRLSWYNGTVESVVSHSDQGRWMGSPWRKLQVKWEESDILQNMRTVNPWQVEFIDPTPPTNATFPLTKKFKGVQNPALLNDEEGDPILLSMDFSSMMGQFTPSLLNSNSFPAGMQGARQSSFLLTNGLPSIINDNNNQANNLDENRDRNTINSSHETSLPESQNNVVGMIYNEQLPCNLTKKDVTSFQLFGTVIQMGQPSAIVNNVGSRENDSSEPRGTRNTEQNSSRKARKSSLKKKDAL